MADRLRCHRCGSTDLTLSETCHEHSSFAEIVITSDGRLAALDEGVAWPGEIQTKLTQVECHSCHHIWRPRRPFAGVAAHLDPKENPNG